MENNIAKLAVVSNKTFEAIKTADTQHYDISSALQTTLDFYELISVFSNKIKSLVPHSGVGYSNPQFDIEFKYGITTKHACTYSLKIEEEPLGQLKLMRQQRFTEEEVKQLESLLCCLIYPLSNATRFKQAQLMAFTDALTKTRNRAAFNDTIQREYKLANRNCNHLSLIFADIDHFKTINDRYGHECGDVTLASIANLINRTVRGSDIIFRYGGEEFVILLSNTNLDKARKIAERIRKTVANNTFAYGLHIIQVTISLGVSSLHGNDSIESFIKRADDAMYLAKSQGRNQVVVS